MKRWKLTAAGYALVNLVAVACSGCDSPQENIGNTTHAAPPAVTVPTVGTVCNLSDGSSDVLVGVTEQDEKKMLDAAKSGDKMAFDEAAFGRSFFVPVGTKAKLLGLSSLDVAHVRIQSGSHRGRDGWVSPAWLRK